MNMKFDNPISIRPMINVGALFDIPTGSFIQGPKGDFILNGGLSNIEGIVGTSNNFKSTISHFLMLQAADRIAASGFIPGMHTYDTEDNMALNIDRLNRLADNLEYIPKDPLLDPDIWSFVSKSSVTAEEWIKRLYELAKEKVENKKEFITYEAFVNRITKELIKAPKPNFIEIDSFSEFEPTDTMEMASKGDFDKNTIFMKQGLFKTKFVKDMPRIANTANMYFILTSHLGEEFNIASGPFAPQPKKKLQYLKQGDKIKGIPEKMLFLSTHFWYAHMSKALINQNTGLPEYPINENDVETDLNIVRLTQLRSKSGPSGYTLEIIVSQREGVLPSLTEFHYLKTNKFGIDGSNRSYWIELYPDVKLSRTTVRKKINEDYKLRRAINILAELHQMQTFMPQYENYYCSPKELYEGIKEQGYDWDMILETRGWWTPNNYKTDRKHLTTLDLLRMRKGEYTPYWIEKPKKG